MLRGNFLAINAYIKKEERSQVTNLNFYLKTPENEDQTELEVS